MLNAVIREDLRGVRETLAQVIRDPELLEQAIQVQRQDLEQFYGLDKSWQSRLPGTLFRVITLDMGEARTLRSFSGSPRVLDLVVDRLPLTMLLLTVAFIINGILGLLIGVNLATKAGSRLDRIVSYIAAGSFSLPAWWTGILFIYLFAFQFPIFPSGGLHSIPPPQGGILRFVFRN